jgi:hypothetical protein
MKRTAWFFSLGLCLLVGGSVFLIVASVLFSSYEVERLGRTQKAYPSPEEAFLARHSGAEKVEIEGSAEDLFGLWYVAGWVWQKDPAAEVLRKRSFGSFFVRVEDGWIWVPESPRTLLIGAGNRVRSLLGVSQRFERLERVWERVT